MKQFKLTITVEDHATAQTKLVFYVTNVSKLPLQLDKLCFTMVDGTATKTLENAEFLTQNGSYIELQPINETQIAGLGVWQFTLIVNGQLNQYTDLPAGVFAVCDGEIIEVEYSHADKITARGIVVDETKSVVATSTFSRHINCFPQPKNISLTGEYINLTLGFNLIADEGLEKAFLNAQEIEQDFATSVKIFKQADDGVRLHLDLDTSISSEGYCLKISKSKIMLTAADLRGLHNGLMSLWQVAVLNVSHVACVEISDEPRFEWRGQHLDTARQFFSVAEIKRFINLMALYKLNKFHWHLVDDEAWRAEILALPQLTQDISTRGYEQMVAPAFGSGAATNGGYYSQQDMRDIVAYAAKRQIEVIPEIDIPGHCHALLKAMPELLEAADKSEYHSVQNYKNNCLNPALPQTYEILQQIFTEIADIFPSQYIHIGADERPHGSWEKSPKVAELMAEHGYNSTEQVQTHFINKVQDIIQDLGKQTGAWEEASEQGDIQKNGYIVSWKGVEAGIDAAERGYDVVMSPAQYCYFDIAQSEHFDEPGLTWTGGRLSMQETYNYDPIPPHTAANVAARFKGIQGCLWSENLYDKSIIDHLIFPRLIALSEICWVAAKDKNFTAFKQDLQHLHRPLLDELKIKYRVRDFE